MGDGRKIDVTEPRSKTLAGVYVACSNEAKSAAEIQKSVENFANRRPPPAVCRW